MDTEVLDCCGVSVSLKNLSHHRFIDCFKSKKFFKKRTRDKRKIQKENMLVASCPQCKHYILKYLWYTKENAQFYDYDDTNTFRGEKADEIFSRDVLDLDLCSIPSPYKETPITKHAKNVPWVYGKSLDDTTQVPRYYNESEDAGRKIYNPVKKIVL